MAPTTVKVGETYEMEIKSSIMNPEKKYDVETYKVIVTDKYPNGNIIVMILADNEKRIREGKGKGISMYLNPDRIVSALHIPKGGRRRRSRKTRKARRSHLKGSRKAHRKSRRFCRK